MPVLQSGVIPYGYVVPGPVKTATHAPGSFLQPSGLLFEQAAWVLMAELRRYNASGMFNTAEVVGIPTLNNYPDRRFPVNGLYDPSPIGANLGSYTPAFLQNSTNIGSIRSLMLNLFFGPAGIGGLGRAVAEDWFLETFRNHPRGTVSNPFFSQDIFAHPISENGTAVVGELLINPLTEEDTFFTGRPYYPLGSSGVIYDIDMSELMYQPWPRLTTNAFSNGTSIFGGGSAPIFPQFQTTAGALIAVSNAGFTKFWNDGNFAIRGDLILPGTELLITQVNDFSAGNLIAQLSFVEPGLAPLPSFDNNLSTIAEGAFTPTSLAAGSYRMGIRLPKSVNVNVVIPSGIRTSVFPVINLTTDTGLHVFSDALFLETNTAAAVLSPITQDFKHDCLAEGTIAAPTWRQVMGLVRVTANELVKTGSAVHQTAFNIATGEQTLDIGFVTFDDVVNRVSVASGSVVLPTDDGLGFPPFANPALFDGSIRLSDWFTHNNAGYLIEKSSTRIHRFTGSPMAYDSTIHNVTPIFPFGGSMNGDLWTFGDTGDNRFLNVTGGFVTKTFDVTTNFPALSTTNLILHSVWQVSGAVNVTNGIYVLWSATSGGLRTYKISRMIERATTFEVLQNLVSKATGTTLRGNTHIWWRTI